MKPNIMFVDNSISVLESLQWIFKDEPYYLFAFNKPSDALSVIETLDWTVVVADRFMQEMDVLEFMKRVREYSPQTMGIIMTDYNKFTEVLDPLHLGCVYRFVRKPLDNIEIKQTVKMAIAQYEMSAGIKRQNPF